MSNLSRWMENILYKRVRHSKETILTNQIEKGAEKYADPLPGKWSAKQLIRHAKEEATDLDVYLEATEIVVEQMENKIEVLEHQIAEVTRRAEKAEKAYQDLYVQAERNIRKTHNMGR